MRKLLTCLLYFLVSFAISLPVFAQTIPDDSLYLGQARPGNTPKIFSVPVTAGLRPVERIAITSDNKEIYYGELDAYPVATARIKYFKYLDNKWQGPYIVFEGYMGPRLSGNDSIMYMQKNINSVSTVFYSVRNSSGWSTPVRLLSSNFSTHYFQVTGLHNLYCSSPVTASLDDRDICRFIINNQDTSLQSLGIPVNTSDDENDFYMAKDESYLIFSRSNAATAGDMYICYKTAKGGWTNPKMIDAPISTPSPVWEYGQFVSNDGKYLFFTRGGTKMPSYNIYWVKIDNIIDSLKHTNFVPYVKNQITKKSFPVGKSFAYTIPDSSIIDDDGNNTLTYSATLSNGSPLPAWLSFDSVTRTFSGTPATIGILNVNVNAVDTANASVSCSFPFDFTNAAGTEKTRESGSNGFFLYQNYPNPFNPSTNIRFSLSQREYVTLKVLDILGREIAVLIDNELTPNEYSVVFNAKDMASGLYFYSLKAGNLVQNRQMIFLK